MIKRNYFISFHFIYLFHHGDQKAKLQEKLQKIIENISLSLFCLFFPNTERENYVRFPVFQNYLMLKVCAVQMGKIKESFAFHLCFFLISTCDIQLPEIKWHRIERRSFYY